MKLQSECLAVNYRFRNGTTVLDGATPNRGAAARTASAMKLGASANSVSQPFA